MLVQHHSAFGFHGIAGTLPLVAERKFTDNGDCLIAVKHGWVGELPELIYEIYTPDLTGRALACNCWSAIRDIVFDWASINLPTGVLATAEDSPLALLRMRAIGDACQEASEWMETFGGESLIPAVLHMAERIVFQTTLNDSRKWG